MLSAWITLLWISDLKISKAEKEENSFGSLIFKFHGNPLSFTWIKRKMDWMRAIRWSGREKEMVAKADEQHQIRE